MSEGGKGTLLKQSISAGKQQTPKPKPKSKPTLKLSKEDKELLKNLTLPTDKHGSTEEEIQDFLQTHGMTLQELMKKYGPEPPEKKAKGGYVKKYAKGGGVRKVRT